MKHIYALKHLFLSCVLLFSTVSCVDNAYDLSDISLKMTLGPNGITLPLGVIDHVRIDSLLSEDVANGMTLEDGFYAYKLDSMFSESIDAVVIDPITDVIPELDPYLFKFNNNATLPLNFVVAGFTDNTPVDLPSFDFISTDLGLGVNIVKPFDISDFIGLTLPSGFDIPLPSVDDGVELAFNLNNIPTEVASIDRLYFSGADKGTPIKVKFTTGSLSSAVKEGRLSFSVTMPSCYKITLGSGYGGYASVNGSTLSLTNYPFSTTSVEFVFYLSERSVAEQISSARTLSIEDNINYTFDYTGIANGNTIESGANPTFSFEIAPEVDDALIRTNNIIPAAQNTTSNLEFAIDDLEHISTVDYIAFTTNSSNAINLRASQLPISLKGDVNVKITLPNIFEFSSGVAGLSGNVLTTTLAKLSAGNGVTLPLRGVRLEGENSRVVDDVLTVKDVFKVTIAPNFPGDVYKVSELSVGNNSGVDVAVGDMNLQVDLSQSQISIGLSESISIKQTINETFDVPKEIAALDYAVVTDATGRDAYVSIKIDIENCPVNLLYFDNIVIGIPAFLDAEHPNLDPATNTIRVGRIDFVGKPITIAKIKLKGVKNIPIVSTSTGKKARLNGEITIAASAHVPDGSIVDGLDQTDIIVRPQVDASPLYIRSVKGKTDIDLQQYLKPTSIDMSDMLKSLGSEDIELNLVAPQIILEVNNPVGVAMVGNITLQPYDFKGVKLDPIVIRDIVVKPAIGAQPTVTKLFITDVKANAPMAYTLCYVPDLSNLVRILPSKIDINFNLNVDDSQEQSFNITGKDYPFDVKYEIKLPLKFKDDAVISYTGVSEVTDIFATIDKYDVTVDDILITMNARTTIPFDLNLGAQFLDSDDKKIEGIDASVLDVISGYNSEKDDEYKDTSVKIKILLADGNIKLLKNIAKIKYSLEGKALGKGAGLRPDQYISATMNLYLKHGITLDLSMLDLGGEDVVSQ